MQSLNREEIQLARRDAATHNLVAARLARLARASTDTPLTPLSTAIPTRLHI